MWRLDYIYVFCREAFVLISSETEKAVQMKWNEIIKY